MRNSFHRSFIIAFFNLLICSHTFASSAVEPGQDDTISKHNSQADIMFSGDEAIKQNNIYTLNGHVEIQQDNSTLKSDTASLYYKGTEMTSELERAVAKGHVHISNVGALDESAFQASCQEMEFLPDKKVIFLKGHAKAWQDKNSIQATHITFETDSGNMTFKNPHGTFINAQNIEEQKPDTSNQSSSIKHDSQAKIVFSGHEGLKKNNTYTLKGNVSIHQDHTTLTSDTASLYYNSSEIGADLERAVAKGNVHISRTGVSTESDFRALCDEIEFLPNKKILILRGNAKIWKEDDFIHSKTIVIETDTENIRLDDPRGTYAPNK